MNTLIDFVWMSHTKHVLRYAIWPPPDSLGGDRGSSCVNGSDACFRRNMVWMIKRDVRSNQFGSSMVMVNILSMNPSMDDSMASMSTDSF